MLRVSKIDPQHIGQSNKPQRYDWPLGGGGGGSKLPPLKERQPPVQQKKSLRERVLSTFFRRGKLTNQGSANAGNPTNEGSANTGKQIIIHPEYPMNKNKNIPPVNKNKINALKRIVEKKLRNRGATENYINKLHPLTTTINIQELLNKFIRNKAANAAFASAPVTNAGKHIHPMKKTPVNIRAGASTPSKPAASKKANSNNAQAIIPPSKRRKNFGKGEAAEAARNKAPAARENGNAQAAPADVAGAGANNQNNRLTAIFDKEKIHFNAAKNHILKMLNDPEYTKNLKKPLVNKMRQKIQQQNLQAIKDKDDNDKNKVNNGILSLYDNYVQKKRSSNKFRNKLKEYKTKQEGKKQEIKNLIRAFQNNLIVKDNTIPVVRQDYYDILKFNNTDTHKTDKNSLVRMMTNFKKKKVVKKLNSLDKQTKDYLIKDFSDNLKYYRNKLRETHTNQSLLSIHRTLTEIQKTMNNMKIEKNKKMKTITEKQMEHKRMRIKELKNQITNIIKPQGNLDQQKKFLEQAYRKGYFEGLTMKQKDEVDDSISRMYDQLKAMNKNLNKKGFTQETDNRISTKILKFKRNIEKLTYAQQNNARQTQLKNPATTVNTSTQINNPRTPRRNPNRPNTPPPPRSNAGQAQTPNPLHRLQRLESHNQPRGEKVKMNKNMKQRIYRAKDKSLGKNINNNAQSKLTKLKFAADTNQNVYLENVVNVERVLNQAPKKKRFGKLQPLTATSGSGSPRRTAWGDLN